MDNGCRINCFSPYENPSLFFCLDAKEPKVQVVPYLDPESSKEVKAAPASLLTPFIPLFALQTRFAQTSNALGRSIPVARFTLTSRDQSNSSPAS